MRWPALEDKWVQRYTPKGTRILVCKDYPNIFVPPKTNKKEAPKKAAQKSMKKAPPKEVPVAVPAINDDSPFLLTNVLGLDGRDTEDKAAEEAVHASVVPESCLLIERGDIATPLKGRVQSVVDDVEELVEGKIYSPDKRREDSTTDKGKPIGVIGDLELDNPSESSSPKQCRKRQFFELMADEVGEPCQSGVNHLWHEFLNGKYVVSGFLSGGKRCIGERNGKECGRLFVPRAIAVKVNESDTEFHPTLKKPAYGCPICRNGMCYDCKNHYEQNVRQSPGKKGRIGRNGNKID